MNRPVHRLKPCAFTLLELLVVIGIIAILASLIFPSVKAALGARDETVSLSNMRQIGVAFGLYAGEHSYILPNRAEAQPGDNSSPAKWPALLATYLGDLRVYAASYDTQNWINRHLTQAEVISNDENNTSYIMNGYNDLGAYNDSTVTVRINAFPDTANIILLGTPIIGSRQFYMDFEEGPNGNENDVLNLAAFNGGSNYLFADGSARFITKVDYNKPSPDTTVSGALETYGNWLWKVDKTYQIPTVGNGGKR